MTETQARIRLSADERREQLLDTATVVLVDGGAGALTMERLAEHAGVSKATPYLHFDNAAEVLRALYQRELFRLGGAILEARAEAATPDERLDATVRTFFGVVRDRRVAFLRLQSVDSAPKDEAERNIGVEFVADLLQSDFPLPRRRARLAASILIGAARGAVDAWAAGGTSRADAEAAVTATARALLTTSGGDST